MAPCLLPKISGVKVTPSVTSVESSEQFWRKIRQIWCICESMSSSEDSAVSCTDSEYEMEAESDLDCKASPPTSDDEAHLCCTGQSHFWDVEH